MTLERRDRVITVDNMEEAERITQKLEAIMRDPDLVFALLPTMKNPILPSMMRRAVITQSQADLVLTAAAKTMDFLLTPKQKAEVDKESRRQEWWFSED